MQNDPVNVGASSGFLPLCKKEMDALGWDAPDFVYVSGDAYVDHPSFGTAIISRVLEDAGFRVAILAQPDYKSCDAFREFGRPRLGFLVSAGNIDSMVAHYTAAKKRRSTDYYSPGGKPGLRPDRATIVYCNRVREAYGDIPLIIGGLEASLRRFAHYDYWDDKVRRSILVDSRADLLTYGMGENILTEIARLLDRGVPVKKIRAVRGCVYLCSRADRGKINFPVADEFDYNLLKTDKAEYARAFGRQYKNQDSVSGKAIVEYYDDKMLVQNPPMPPLEREELDHVYSLPYMRDYHPSYKAAGGVPAIEEVKFSITHNRGCFGECAFCALTFHQGRSVRSRSIESVVAEAEKIAALPDFKGYIHDVGGPTANFRYPSCKKQLTEGTCVGRRCLTPKPCPNLFVDHSEYLKLIETVENVPGVKKVFIRSGIRFDYLLADPDDSFFRKLVRDNVSGQLKVAPEHCSPDVLRVMGKPDFSVYEDFSRKYFALCEKAGKEQYLVPYLMSSHPGSTLNDAVKLALCLKKEGLAPEQVQDFYPTPGTASTVMYYTGINPLDGKKIYSPTEYHEKQLQRALLQYSRRENAPLVREALIKCGREDLIGSGPECLVREGPSGSSRQNGVGSSNGDRGRRDRNNGSFSGQRQNQATFRGREASDSDAKAKSYSKAKTPDAKAKSYSKAKTPDVKAKSYSKTKTPDVKAKSYSKTKTPDVKTKSNFKNSRYGENKNTARGGGKKR